MSIWIHDCTDTMKSLAILVVDDHPVMRDVICQILEDSGHDVRCAAEGREALRKLSCAHFDLVVTDIVMPEMDGLELIGEIRRRYLDTRIIAVSGGGERFLKADGLQIARRLGAGVCLDKPFAPQQLIEAVEGIYPSATYAM